MYAYKDHPMNHALQIKVKKAYDEDVTYSFCKYLLLLKNT